MKKRYQQTRKKHIIISSYDDISHPVYAGGGARAVFEVASRLTSSYSITVITGNYPGAKNKKMGGVMYKRIGPANINPKLGQLVFHMLLPIYVKKEFFDLWIESFTPPFSTSFLQLFTHKPVVGLAHMLASEDMQRKYKLPFHYIEKIGLKTYKQVIAITHESRKKISSIHPKASVYVISNGVNEVSVPHPKSTKKHILFMGRIEYDQKGLDLLLDAYTTIADKTSQTLVIAGVGHTKDLQQLKKYINSHQLEKKVQLVGRVSGTKKDRLFKEASLVVIPSRFETFGTVALEAMAYNIPLIGFNIRGLTWIPANCMIKVKPFDSKKLGEKMLYVLHDKKSRHELSAASKKMIKSYSWNTIAKQYKDIIQAILQNSQVKKLSL
jgi:glycosyltransferase involved in cell wall biosynthesis